MAGDKNKTAAAFAALVQAGKAEAEKVQNIKSVASQTEDKNENSVETTISNPKEEQTDKAVKVSEVTKNDSKKGLAMLFSKREIKETEAVKIPREFHKELKLLSLMSKISMQQLLGNLIEDFLQENQKEIATYKKRYLSGSI